LCKNLCVSKQWFGYLKEIISHPVLQKEEKIVWLWLATQCINNSQFACSFTYEQIAYAVNKPTRGIHRILFCLKSMGILQGNIPILIPKEALSAPAFAKASARAERDLFLLVAENHKTLTLALYRKWERGMEGWYKPGSRLYRECCMC